MGQTTPEATGTMFLTKIKGTGTPGPTEAKGTGTMGPTEPKGTGTMSTGPKGTDPKGATTPKGGDQTGPKGTEPKGATTPKGGEPTGPKGTEPKGATTPKGGEPTGPKGTTTPKSVASLATEAKAATEKKAAAEKKLQEISNAEDKLNAAITKLKEILANIGRFAGQAVSVPTTCAELVDLAGKLTTAASSKDFANVAIYGDALAKTPTSVTCNENEKKALESAQKEAETAKTTIQAAKTEQQAAVNEAIAALNTINQQLAAQGATTVPNPGTPFVIESKTTPKGGESTGPKGTQPKGATTPKGGESAGPQGATTPVATCCQVKDVTNIAGLEGKYTLKTAGQTKPDPNCKDGCVYIRTGEPDEDYCFKSVAGAGATIQCT